MSESPTLLLERAKQNELIAEIQSKLIASLQEEIASLKAIQCNEHPCLISDEACGLCMTGEGKCLDEGKNEIAELRAENAKLKTTQLRKVYVSDEDTENDYGYFIEIDNELYCDIIKSKQGKWSVFFYDRKTGSDALGDQVDIDKLRAKIVELESRTKLEVWLGEMPESNGKTNHTAILRRKGESLLDSAYFTIARSEYPDRVRYEADRVRYLIGEIPENPFILDYDADKHSGYKGAKLEQAALNSKASDFHHVCNLWIDPKSKNYVVDRCDHPPSECIPAFVLMPTDTVNSEPAQASQPTKCIEFIQHQVIGGTTFNALSSGAQDWIMGACENYDNKTKQKKGE